MHMHMLWRADAGVDRIDIGDKVTGHELLVNAISSLRQSISSMKRPWGVWGGAKHSPRTRTQAAGSWRRCGSVPETVLRPMMVTGRVSGNSLAVDAASATVIPNRPPREAVIPRSFVRPGDEEGDEESAGAGAEAADPSGPCVPESL